MIDYQSNISFLGSFWHDKHNDVVFMILKCPIEEIGMKTLEPHGRSYYTSQYDLLESGRYERL